MNVQAVLVAPVGQGGIVPVGQLHRLSRAGGVEVVVIALESDGRIIAEGQSVAGRGVQNVVRDDHVLREEIVPAAEHFDGIAGRLIDGVVDDLRVDAAADENAARGIGVDEIVQDERIAVAFDAGGIGIDLVP